MPHIAITMLPGRTPEQKKSLACRLREALASELGVDKLLVSVSVEDLALENWDGFLKGLPDDSILIPETDKEDEKFKNRTCNCCKPA